MESSSTVRSSLRSVNPANVLSPLLTSFFDGICRPVGGEFVGIQADGRPVDDPLVLVRSLSTGSTIAIPFAQYEELQVALALMANAAKFQEVPACI